MIFENKNISINFVKIIIILSIIQAITQYVVLLFFINNYNQFITRQFLNLFFKLIKNQFYKKKNRCLYFFNRLFRNTLIILIEFLLRRKKNIFIIKFLFKLLKIYEKNI